MKDLIININYACLFLNVVLYTLPIKHAKKHKILFQIFRGYIYYTAAIQLSIILYKIYYPIRSNWFISHFYFIGQFIILSYFFRKLIALPKIKRIILILQISIPAIICGYFILKPEIFRSFSLLESSLCSLSLCVYILVYLIQALQREQNQWLLFSTGLLVYLITSFLLFGYGAEILEKYGDNIFLKFWNINNSIYIVYQIFITIEWYKYFRKKIH